MQGHFILNCLSMRYRCTEQLKCSLTIIIYTCIIINLYIYVAQFSPPPPSLAAKALKGYGDDIHQCFSELMYLSVDETWLQAQLSLSREGLGIFSFSHRSSTAYKASLSVSGQGFTYDHNSIIQSNFTFLECNAISADDITVTVHEQRLLSSKLEDHQ